MPVAIGVHASFPVTPGCVRSARWDGLVADPVSLQWNPDRLASATITDGVLALGEGDTPDFGSIGFGGEVEDHHRSMSFYFPWGPEAVGAVPNAHVELPPDLEALYGFDGEPDTVIAHDVLGADGYDAALAADPRALREWASSRECAR